MIRSCPKCSYKECEGEDLGDNGTFLNFQCPECNYSWADECASDFVDQAMAQRDDLEQKDKKESRKLQ